MFGKIKELSRSFRELSPQRQNEFKKMGEKIERLESRVATLDLILALLPQMEAGDYDSAIKTFKGTRQIEPNDRESVKHYFNSTVLAKRSLEWNPHGVKKTFRFYTTEEKIHYLNFGKEVAGLIAESTPNVCFGFGTVLGLIRDNDLIPHDDDIDLIVCVPKVTDIGEGVKIIGDRMAKRGLSVILRDGHLKVYRKGIRTLDIFPGYGNGDFVNWRPGPRDKILLTDVFPAVPIDAFGVSIEVPRNTRHYLELVYGETWITPLPAFKHVWRNFDDKVAKKK